MRITVETVESKPYLDSLSGQLEDAFGRYGLAISVRNSTQKDRKDKYVLVLDIDTDTVKHTHNDRGAGRKAKQTGKLRSEVAEYAETHTPEETASWLGLSLRTYQRRLKSHGGHSLTDDMTWF